ncbi:aspartyl protease family protein [Spirosoma sp. BT702]|uniref:Aspartyl protease family protein n=2 Tax=Spirosoma profusum TaxID=2771354 RepID=A0A926Y2P9_9BACT|nr:aspartyl protease family protein [Spirosoma profusum]
MLFFAVLGLPQMAIGQNSKYGFYVASRQNRVQIPFEYRSNLIIIPVCINEQYPMHFIVDTGVSHTIITDANVFQNSTFATSRTIKLAGVGGSNALVASVSTGNSLRIGKLRSDLHTLVILSEDIMHLSEYAGMPIQGIIGYELFADLVVTLDFEHQVITLVKPDKYKYRPADGEKHPISIQEKKVYTDLLSVSNGRAWSPLRAIIDTGAGQALLLDRFQRCQVPVPDKVIPVSLGKGLTGEVRGELGRLSTIRVGRYVLSDVLVAYPDSLDFGLKLAQLPPRQGNIGCELLRRFRVTFNYPAGYLVIKPVKRSIDEPFVYDMSGLELRARGTEFDQYVITQVVKDSPAEKAGIQVGDELIWVNNNPATQLTMGEIYRMLLAGEGKQVSVIVRRQSQVSRHQILLKRLI